MKSAKLEIVIHCAKDLKDVKHLSRMNPVATVWVAGDGLVSKKKTPVAEKGDCNPKWECSIHFEITSINTKYTLFIKLEHRGSWTQRLIGEVQVPFADLVKAGDAHAWCRAAYPVTIPYGRKQGEIIFSRKFSEEVVSSSYGPPLRRKNPGEVNMIGTGEHQEAGNGMAAGIAEGITDSVATAATTALLKKAIDGDDKDKYEDEDEDQFYDVEQDEDELR